MNNTCPYCGNNPVPHFLHWYFESVNVLFTPLRRFLLYNPVTEYLQNTTATRGFGLAVTELLARLRVISYNDRRDRCNISRAGVLWEEAEKRNIAMRELLLFGHPFDTYVAEKKVTAASGTANPAVRKVVFSGMPRPLRYDRRALDGMDDKLLLKQKLDAAGIPVPKGRAVTSFLGAKRVFASVTKPVIVKPRAGSRGRHSTTFVSTQEELKAAFRVAKRLCYWVIVEEHLVGPVYRATVIGYRLQGVLRGDAAFVTGDGISTIAELVEKKNHLPHPGVADVVMDQKMKNFLRRSLVQMSSAALVHSGVLSDQWDPSAYVPLEGERVELSEKIGVSYGGSSREDFDICHPDNAALFERAARVVGDPIVGFDFIIPDIARSWKEQRCGFIEANSLPFINLHHHPLLGSPRNVAAAVWDLIEF